MRHVQLIGVIVCATFVVSCESTQTAGQGNQERKRLAAMQQRSRERQPDESEQNLWSAQQNTINMDGNPMRRY
jgi:hypothetical protein